jgi:hypothetical protein
LRARRLIDHDDGTYVVNTRHLEQRLADVEREGADPTSARRERREGGDTHGYLAPPFITRPAPQDPNGKLNRFESTLPDPSFESVERRSLSEER